jgi:hypothetical protein
VDWRGGTHVHVTACGLRIGGGSGGEARARYAMPPGNRN